NHRIDHPDEQHVAAIGFEILETLAERRPEIVERDPAHLRRRRMDRVLDVLQRMVGGLKDMPRLDELRAGPLDRILYGHGRTSRPCCGSRAESPVAWRPCSCRRSREPSQPSCRHYTPGAP